MLPKSITLITLGVADLARARAFYAALGWEAAQAPEGVVFIQLAGQVLALFGIDDLAADMQPARGGARHRGGDAGAELRAPRRRWTRPSRWRCRPGRRC